MLSRFQRPREVRPLTKSEVTEISPFVPKPPVISDAKQAEDLRDHMVSGLEKSLTSASIRVDTSRNYEMDMRLVELAMQIKDLRWDEMMQVAEFVSRKLSVDGARVDPNVLAMSLNEWKNFVLCPPVVDAE